mgnify:CR=1 FL=1
MRFEIRIQLVEHHAGLHFSGPRVLVESDDLIQVLAVVDHERRTDRLAALRRAAAAREHRHALVHCDLQRNQRILLGPGHHHADRLDLVNRGIGRVTPARPGVEQHLALDFLAQARGERAVV